MKQVSLLILGLLTCGLSIPANGQGLIGIRHAEFQGGYLRFKDSLGTIDGWGAGASANIPVVQEERYGFDFQGGASYLRISDDGFRTRGYGLGGLMRGYARLDPRFLPFADVGLFWSESKVRFEGETDTFSGFSLPVGVGIEFYVGPFSITPFFEYQFGLNNDVEDSWSLGAKGAYWLNREWGLTLEGAYTEFDDDFDGWSIFAGVVYAF